MRSFTKSRAQRVNERNRGISEYKPNSIDAFLQPEFGVGSLTASGGCVAARNSILCAQADCAQQNMVAAVILHEGNHFLEDAVRARFGGSAAYAEVSRARPAFEPVYGLGQLDIANEFIQSATKDYDVKYNARYYLDGVAEFLSRTGKNMSFQMLLTCPHLQIFDKVDDAWRKGKLTDAQAQEIKSKLMMGQTENLKLETIFYNLQMELEPILWKKNSGYQPLSIFSAIRDRKLLIFDLLSVNNTMLLNILMFQLRLASARGMQFALLLDGLPVDANEQYADLLKKASTNIALTAVSEDLYAMVGGNDRLFDSLVGNSPLTVVMSHPSGHSAKKWAEVIGQYDAWRESYSKSFTSQTNPKSFWNSYSSGSSTTTSRAREFIVQPEWISRMQPDEAYVISRQRQEMAHLRLVL